MTRVVKVGRYILGCLSAHFSPDRFLGCRRTEFGISGRLAVPKQAWPSLESQVDCLGGFRPGFQPVERGFPWIGVRQPLRRGRVFSFGGVSGGCFSSSSESFQSATLPSGKGPDRDGWRRSSANCSSVTSGASRSLSIILCICSSSASEISSWFLSFMAGPFPCGSPGARRSPGCLLLPEARKLWRWSHRSGVQLPCDDFSRRKPSRHPGKPFAQTSKVESIPECHFAPYRNRPR